MNSGLDLTTPAAIKLLMQGSRSEQEWNDNCDKVKAANNGHYPTFWFLHIIVSGLLNNTRIQWGW